MACLGVHFAITDEELEAIESFTSDEDRLNYLKEELEETYFEQHSDYLAESDKSWDAMHRALSDGELSYSSGPEPLRFAVIGGVPLYSKGDYIISLKTPLMVGAVAQALSKITYEEFQKLYEAIDETKYGVQKSPEDMDYTWSYLTSVRDLFIRAEKEERCVIFTADQ
jgi:hypothetical protein